MQLIIKILKKKKIEKKLLQELCARVAGSEFSELQKAIREMGAPRPRAGIKRYPNTYQLQSHLWDWNLGLDLDDQDQKIFFRNIISACKKIVRGKF